MNETCEDLVTYLVKQGSDYCVVNGLVFLAGEYDPVRFMHLVPAELRSKLQEECRIVPASIDEFGYIEGGVYSASAFAGLSPAEIQVQIEQSRRARKEQILRGLGALNRFFAATPPTDQA